MTIFALVFLMLFVVLFLQLNNLQILQASKLAHAPGNSRNASNAFSLPRGAILTADGQVLAKSVPSKGIYHYQRVFPGGALYAPITGFDSLIYGQSGIEAAYNTYLEGHQRTIHSISDFFKTTVITDSVQTTINAKLQQVAFQALGGKVGSVVAIDPQTGGILALVSSPSYDPTPLSSPYGSIENKAWKAYTTGSLPPLLDYATGRAFPPGSTFKVVVTSAVYDHDPSLATTNYPSVSQIALPQTTNTLHNYAYESCGGQMPELLKVSCDTGYAQLGLSLGASNLSTEAENFGFNQRPPLDISGAAASSFPPVSFFSQNLPQLAYSSIGQGNVSATPLQMALVAAGIANGGRIMAPHLMGSIIGPQGQVVRRYSTHVWKVATSSATAAKVTTLMEGVVNGGTAQDIALPGVKIAAKTGTAQFNLGTQTSGSGQSDNWMIAFAPAQHPTIAVAVVVPAQIGLAPNPTGALYAGPVVKAVLAAALGVG
ncbi:MAG: peptidoglycan D,D-transpeptidase FtsI family protein [Acidimicrobiales bacterium]